MFSRNNSWIKDDIVTYLSTIQIGLICMVFISSRTTNVPTCILLYLFLAIALIIIDKPSPFVSLDFANSWLWSSIPNWI